MQIIELDVEDWNQFCSFSDQKVFSEIGQANASNLRGGWCSDVPDQRIHLSSELKSLGEAHMETQRALWSRPTGRPLSSVS